MAEITGRAFYELSQRTGGQLVGLGAGPITIHDYPIRSRFFYFRTPSGTLVDRIGIIAREVFS